MTWLLTMSATKRSRSPAVWSLQSWLKQWADILISMHVIDTTTSMCETHEAQSKPKSQPNVRLPRSFITLIPFAAYHSRLQLMPLRHSVASASALLPS
jgi:hypothetical protein